MRNFVEMSSSALKETHHQHHHHAKNRLKTKLETSNEGNFHTQFRGISVSQTQVVNFAIILMRSFCAGRFTLNLLVYSSEHTA